MASVCGYIKADSVSDLWGKRGQQDIGQEAEKTGKHKPELCTGKTNTGVCHLVAVSRKAGRAGRTEAELCSSAVTWK